MHTGENEQALSKILDMTRLMGLVILGLHFYYYCYGAFAGWGLQSAFTDRILTGLQRSGLFSDFQKSKRIALGFLLISLMGTRGRKDEKLHPKTAFAYIVTGLAFYSLSYLSSAVILTSKRVSNSVYGYHIDGIFASTFGRYIIIQNYQKEAEPK